MTVHLDLAVQFNQVFDVKVAVPIHGITQLMKPKIAQRPRQIAFDRSAIELSDSSLFQIRNIL